MKIDATLRLNDHRRRLHENFLRNCTKCGKYIDSSRHVNEKSTDPRSTCEPSNSIALINTNAISEFDQPNSINLKDRKNHEDGPEHSQNGKVKAEESHGLTADIFTSPVSRRVVFLADY